MSLARRVHEQRQAIRLGGGDLASARREAVVATAVVVGLSVQRDVELLDQAVHHHALDRSIERARPQLGLAIGDPLHVLHDAVAVHLAVGQRNHDLKDRRRDRGARSGRVIARLTGYFCLGYNHGGYIYGGLSWPARARWDR